jgi:pyruvate,water dikinase
VLIHGAWGLGVGTVSGSVSPDTWTVADTAPYALLASRLGCKDDRVEPAAEGGLATTAVPQEQRDRFCLSEDQVRSLADLVVQAASHYGRPQEVEWAVDREGRAVLLQARPLQVGESAQPPGHAAAVDGHRLLLTGTGASRGCGSGPVWRPPADDSLASFPAGAVLVARNSSPRYVEVMDRAAAIVTDIGASTGHMASLAREFGVPTVLDTRSATEVLADDLVVTVDADGGHVYEGRAERLLEAGPARTADRSVLGTPVHAILTEVARYVVPLTLTDPRSRNFRPQGCQSFHDIARFVHEKSFDVMFQMSDRVTSAQHRATKLEERLPFLLYLIDIGGGLGQVSSPHATREDIRSEPMRALLQGMMHPGLRWWEPRPISVSGFLSVAAETMMGPTDGDHHRRLGDRSYAIVAEAYCNFSSRIGYHFAAVDSHCSDSRSRNYISFRFKGGAADDGRRARRCELIGAILRRLDFQVERNSDLINARLRKYPREEVLARLDQIGRLVVASRQLDMRLGPGAAIDWYADAFFEGNYLFEPPARPKRTGAGSAGPAV